MRKYLCWLFGHSFICLFRWHSPHTEVTGWVCEHCDKIHREQWDTEYELTKR